MTVEEVFYHTVRASYYLCVLAGVFCLPNLINDDDLEPRTLFLNGCGRFSAFPDDPEPLIGAICAARLNAVAIGKEARFTGYSGPALETTDELIARAKDAIAFSPILEPQWAEYILGVVNLAAIDADGDEGVTS